MLNFLILKLDMLNLFSARSYNLNCSNSEVSRDFFFFLKLTLGLRTHLYEMAKGLNIYFTAITPFNDSFLKTTLFDILKAP